MDQRDGDQRDEDLRDEDLRDEDLRDEDLRRLTDLDPAGADPDLGALRARVMAATSGGEVLPLRRTGLAGRWGRGPLAVAAAAALVVAAGGGVLAGRSLTPQDTMAGVSFIPSMGGGSGDGRQATTGGPNVGAPEMAGADAKVAGSSAMYWGGWRVLLQPTSSVPNEAGTAKAWRFNAAGVDLAALAGRLAALVGAEGDVRTEGQSYSVGGTDGMTPSAWVYDDPMATFYAYVPANSPWACVKDEPVAVDGGGSSGSTGSSAGGSSEPGRDVACDPAESDEAPSRDAALKTARDAFTALGLDLGSVRLVTREDPGSVNVTAFVVIDGNALQNGWSVDISGKGLYNINGFAAELEALPDYAIIGARDAALRTSDPRWSGFSPMQLWGNGGVGIARDTAVSSTTAAAPPATRTVDGRPMLTVTVNTVTVTSATAGLAQYWLTDQVVLLPTWEYKAADGTSWSMVAIADRYVDFVNGMG